MPQELIMNREPAPASNQEEILARASVERMETLFKEGAIYRVKFQDDGWAVYKPVTEINPERRKNYLRERAAFLVSHQLGFDSVPPTVIRDLGMGEGSVQQWIEVPKTQPAYQEILGNSKAISKYGNELLKLWLFDYIIWHSDRNPTNLVLSDNRIFSIDNEDSFMTSTINQTQHEFWDTIIPSSIINKLKSFVRSAKPKELKKQLEPLLSKEEIDALFARINNLGNLIIADGGKIDFAHRSQLSRYNPSYSINQG